MFKNSLFFIVFKRLFKIMKTNKIGFYGSIFLCLLKTVFNICSSILLGIIIQNAFLQFSTANSNDQINQALLLLILGCVGLFFGYTFYFLSFLFAQKIILKLTFKCTYTIRQLFFYKINKIPLFLLEKHQSGDLVSRGTTDANALGFNLALCVGEVFVGPIVVLCIFIGLLIISPLLTAITLVFYLIVLFFSIFIAKKTSSKYNKTQSVLGELNHIVEEYIMGRKAIKSYGYENEVIKNFEEINNKQAKIIKNAETRLNFIWPFNDFIEVVMYAILYFLGIVFYVYNIFTGSVIFPSFSIGIVTSFVLLARIATGETANSLRLINTVQKTLVVNKRLNEILDYENEIDYGKIDQKLNGKITFKNVTFGYEQNKMVLKNVSFEIKPNQTIAIVGPTGSGKTTITSLLTRLYEISSGSILIDDIDIKNISKKCLASNIAVVLQDSFIFSESVYRNIWYGNTKSDINKVKDVAIKAHSDQFIKKLVNGYDTIMSEKMTDLSQGQMQLVAITRAFNSDAKILILDEATSFVDTKTETEIQNALLEVTKNKTVIVIAHRLSTVINADKIIVIKDGQIIEIGNHNQLINNKGFYYQLYSANTIME